MNTKIRTKLACIALLGGAATLLPGCIVGEIRDNLVLANESLARVEVQLHEVSETNDHLVELQDSLKQLATIDLSLQNVDGELDGIAESLKRLDDHLVSLRKTLRSIDSTIPFLSISDDEEIIERPPDDVEDDPPQPSNQGDAGGGG